MFKKHEGQKEPSGRLYYGNYTFQIITGLSLCDDAEPAVSV